MIKVDAFLTPYFPEKENQFSGAIVVMIDVLRASTSICAALYNGAKEVVPIENLEKAVQIYSGLSKESRFLGGERNGLKPSGFDAGNSPLEYTKEAVSGKMVIITTTNGTKIFQKAKMADSRVIASFVNLSSIMNFFRFKIESRGEQPTEINILCAGNNGRISYEDILCCGAITELLTKNYPELEMTDTAHLAKNLYNLHSIDLKNFIKSREHAVELSKLGFDADIEEALELNKYPVVPLLSGTSIKKFEI